MILTLSSREISNRFSRQTFSVVLTSVFKRKKSHFYKVVTKNEAMLLFSQNHFGSLAQVTVAKNYIESKKALAVNKLALQNS